MSGGFFSAIKNLYNCSLKTLLFHVEVWPIHYPGIIHTKMKISSLFFSWEQSNFEGIERPERRGNCSVTAQIYGHGYIWPLRLFGGLEATKRHLKAICKTLSPMHWERTPTKRYKTCRPVPPKSFFSYSAKLNIRFKKLLNIWPKQNIRQNTKYSVKYWIFG